MSSRTPGLNNLNNIQQQRQAAPEKYSSKDHMFTALHWWRKRQMRIDPTCNKAKAGSHSQA
jgi:hypothetical protein